MSSRGLFITVEGIDGCGKSTQATLIAASYPLPARGKLSATGEVCEHCGAPVVVVETARGPWRICVNMDCPGKEKKPARGKAAAKKTTSTAKKTTAKKTTTKKTAAKKTAAEKTATEKA